MPALVESKFLTMQTQSHSSAHCRQVTFMGRDFLVIPAVFVRSQVLHNNLGACMLPASDITADWARGWNGIPVLVGPHPSLRGVPTSGRSPDLWNERCVGWMFNVRAEADNSNSRRLAGEVWIDVQVADAVLGGPEVLSAVRNGRPVELSTGFQTEVVQSTGTLNGAVYNLVLHPGDPDHLVISTEMTGACSVQDGCGLGVNKYEGALPMPENNTTVQSRASELWSKVKEKMGLARNAADAAIEARLAADLAIHETMPVSDQQRMARIQSALQDQYQGRGEIYVTDVYTADSLVVWWIVTPLGPEPPGSEYFRSSFAEDSAGAFTFGEPERVRRVSGYEPVGNTEAPKGEDGKSATNCGCKTPTPAGNNQSEDDMNQQEMEKAINDLTTNMASLVSAVNGLVTKVGDVEKVANSKSESAAINGIKATVASLEDKLDSMASITQTAVQEQQRTRKDLITRLAGNVRCTYTEAELEEKSLTELQKIDGMLAGNFSGRGGPRSGANNTAEEQSFVAPVPYFTRDTAKVANGGAK